jgi:hypothetical protein
MEVKNVRIKPLKVNKTQKNKLISKNESIVKTKTIEMKHNNSRKKIVILKRNKFNGKNKLSSSINSQQILPLSGSISSSISNKKSIKVTTPNFRQLNSLREKILSSEDKIQKLTSYNSISKISKITKINSIQKIKVNKSKNNISLKKLNPKINQINNNENILKNNNLNKNNNITSSNTANKQTNYSSFETSEKNFKNKIQPTILENQFRNLRYEYKEEESNFLNYELANTKNCSILPDFSINLTNFPIQENNYNYNNNIEEKEINIEELFNNYQRDIIDNISEPSIYYIDTKEMKDGEDIHQVYSMTLSANKFYRGSKKEIKGSKIFNKNLNKLNSDVEVNKLLFQTKQNTQFNIVQKVSSHKNIDINIKNNNNKGKKIRDKKKLLTAFK